MELSYSIVPSFAFLYFHIVHIVSANYINISISY